MAIVATDWTIERDNGNIRYTGDDHDGASPSYATVIEFHRWLQDLADDAVAVSSSLDELDITNLDPSARSTDNIITLKGAYNIDDNASEHLYDGSIKQGTGGTETIYAGFVNFGNVDNIQIIQNGAVLADDWWNLAAGGGVNSTTGISHRFMLKVRDAGADIDGRKIIATSRRFGYTSAEFTVSFATEGNNVLALSESTDLNNQTAVGTVATWTDITNVTEGYNGIDVNNDGSDEFYYSEWDLNGRDINDFYERAKWLTREGSTETLYGLNGELFRGITHQIDLNTAGTNSGTFNAFEPVSWTGGTGQMLAIEDTTASAADTMWIQLLTGSPPGDGVLITGGTSSATATTAASGAVTDRSVSFPFVGQSTGSALIGAYGLGVETDDLTAADKVTDLGNNLVIPPNNVTYTVSGLVSGEDYVIVAPWDGTTTDVNGDPAFDKDQLSLSTSLTTDNITSVVVSTSIPSDTPSTGTIRVTDDDGLERRLEYSSWTGSTFTISSTDGNEDFASVNATSTNDVYITYIDVLASGTTESFTVVYSADRDLVVLVRDGGGTPIKQFISAGLVGSSGGGISVIRTSDL